MEKTLTRQQQVRLTQMKNGFCSQLNDYLHRINASETDICRFCKKGKETVKHVLASLANLAPKTFWTNPKRAATKTEGMRGPAQQQHDKKHLYEVKQEKTK